MSHLLTPYLAFHYLNGKAVDKIPISVREGSFNLTNQFFYVSWPDECPAWIIKQPYWPISDQYFDIANEGTVGRKLSLINAIAEHVPRFIDYNPRHRILINELSEGYCDISHITDKSELADLITVVAEMMSSTHFHITSAALSETKGPPWYYFKPCILANNIAYFNPILQNVHHTFVRRNWLSQLVVESRLSEILFSMSQSWRSETIIHGDPHWGNILFKEEDGKIKGLQLCDWEFAGWGDRDWDFACFFQGILDKYLSARINHFDVISAGEQFFTTYQGALQNFQTRAQPAECFESWFKRVLQLSAIGSIQKLLKLDTEHTDVSDQIIEPKRARIEFFLKGVILNPDLIYSF